MYELIIDDPFLLIITGLSIPFILMIVAVVAVSSSKAFAEWLYYMLYQAQVDSQIRSKTYDIKRDVERLGVRVKDLEKQVRELTKEGE